MRLTSARLSTGLWFMLLVSASESAQCSVPRPCVGTRIPIVGLSPEFISTGGFMNDSLQTVYGAASSSVALEQRHRVLRNTYWLLALSLVPTVLGAWLGVSTGIMRSMGNGMSVLIFFAGAFGFMFAIE